MLHIHTYTELFQQFEKIHIFISNVIRMLTLNIARMHNRDIDIYIQLLRSLSSKYLLKYIWLT